MFSETTEALLNVCIAPVVRAVGSASPKLPRWRAAMTTSGCPAARTNLIYPCQSTGTGTETCRSQFVQQQIRFIVSL